MHTEGYDACPVTSSVHHERYSKPLKHFGRAAELNGDGIRTGIFGMCYKGGRKS